MAYNRSIADPVAQDILFPQHIAVSILINPSHFIDVMMICIDGEY